MNIVAVSYPSPAFAMTPRDLTQITTLIIHHSAGALDQTPLQIDQEHRGEGWAMIGYNWVIVPDGTVYIGRPTQYVPSAAYGDNTPSVDVCLIGNFQSDDPGYTGPPTAAQIQSLKDFSVIVHQHYPTISQTIGHRDVAALYPNDPGDYSTACPGDQLYSQIPAVKAYVLSKIG